MNLLKPTGYLSAHKIVCKVPLTDDTFLQYLRRHPWKFRAGTLALAVDFDFTCTHHDSAGRFFSIPRLREGADSALRTLYDMGWYILIHSARFNPQRFSAKQRQRSAIHVNQTFNHYGLKLDTIWRRRGKPMATFYVDDRSFPPLPHWNIAERYFSDYMSAAEKIFAQVSALSYRDAMAEYRARPKDAKRTGV